MFSKLRPYWDYGSTFCGIELTTIAGEENVFGISAKKRQGEYTDLEFLQFQSIQEVGKKLPKQQHCFVAINTDKVLIKVTPNQDSDLKVVSNAFPGLSLTDFYYEILKVHSESIVTICRKDYVDNILRELKHQNIQVLGFHLGITSLQVLAPLIRVEYISVPRYHIGVNRENITDIIPNEIYASEIYKLDDIEVASEYMLSLAMLFCYTGAQFNLSNNFGEENKNLLRRHQERNFFKKGVFLGVGFLLISLLVNMFFFNSYFKREQRLNEELVFMEIQQGGMESKLEEVNKKEKVVNHILNSGSSKTSYYLNKIVASKPVSIGFSDIQYQPLYKSIRPDKQIEYSLNSIVCSGESKDKTDFSQWITGLGTLEWVEKVSVSHYGNLGKDNSSFSITIAIKK